MINRSLNAALLALLLPLALSAEDINEQLLTAARKSDIESVKTLLAKGADVNAKTSYGVTPLSFAADRGSLEVVKVLLEHGGDVNAKDNFYQQTPLGRAAYKGHADIVRALLEKGATGADEALNWAVYGGRVDVVQAVLEKGSVKPETLSSSWAEASKNGKSEMADLLKKAGAVPPPKADFQVDPETLKSYVGVYKNQEGAEISITLENGKLMGGFMGQGSYSLGAIDKVTFKPTEFEGVTLTFNLENGKIAGLSLKHGETPEVFKRVE